MKCVLCLHFSKNCIKHALELLFKGTWTRCEFIFSIAWTKSESQISSYKRITEVRILCFVNKARVLLMFTYLLPWYKFLSNVTVCCDEIIYKPIESVYLVSTSKFDKEMAISLLYSICKRI